MTDKKRAGEILESLPDDATWDEIIDAFRLDIALTESIAAAERGDVIPHEEVMRRFARCATNPSS